MEVEVKGSQDFMNNYDNLDPVDRRKIDEVMDYMKQDVNKGEKIERRLFPRRYSKDYGINNLFRYKVGSSRLLYTIIVINQKKTYVLLDFLNHREYDNLFGYSTS